MDHPDFMDNEEITEERVLELGNKVLEVLGSEDKITEIEYFCMDALYLQLFQALFPQFDFENIEPGKTEEEMAENINTLIKLLEKNILETDLSDIKAEAIVSGDLVHIDEFLQVLLQVVFLMVQNQGEGEESEESMDSKQLHSKGASSKKKDNSSVKKEKNKNRSHSDAKMEDPLDNSNDETDTQKLAAGLGLDSPDIDDIDMKHDAKNLFSSGGDKHQKDENSDRNSRIKSDKRKGHADSNDDMDDENEVYSDLDFYGKNIPDKKQVIMNDEDEEALLMNQEFKPPKQEEQKSPQNLNNANKKESSKVQDNKDQKNKQPEKPKAKVDVLNDPLLPEGVDFGSKKQKRQRADSLGGKGGSFNGGNLLGDQDEEDDDLLVIDNLDELDEEQKYMVLQHLFEEYQKDPEAFPEDQKQFLEHEMMKLYQKAELEGELDDEEEYEGHSNNDKHVKGKDRMSSGKKDKKWIDDSDKSDKLHQNKDSDKKAKPRLLKDESDDDKNKQKDNKKIAKNKEDEEDEEYMKEIIDQQIDSSAKSDQKQMESDKAKEMSNSKKNSEHAEEGEGEGEQEQEFMINEEEFNKLPPEEQQKMLMMLQMQQQYAQQQEAEGEGDQMPHEVNQEYLNALQQQMMNQNAMQVNERQRTKYKKTKSTKKRPSTAKHGLSSKGSRLTSKQSRRPDSAVPRRKRKSKSKSKQKKRQREQQYMNQLHQQQYMQQLAHQQQMYNQNPTDEEHNEMMQNLNNLQPVDENGNPVDLTPEQLKELQMQYLQQQEMEADQQQYDENGEPQLTPEQYAMLQRQAYEQSLLAKKKPKRKASAKRKPAAKKPAKTKKPKRKAQKQQIDEQTAFLMMLQQNPELQQQFLQQHMQQMDGAQGPDDQMYNVDKIEEEENEESPMKSQPVEHPGMQGHHGQTEESANTDEMAHHQMKNMGADDEGIYEEDGEQEQYEHMMPEEDHPGQMMNKDPRMAEYQQKFNQYYSPHQGNYGNVYDMHNDPQRNMQNESLNGMLRRYIAENARKLRKVKKKKRAASKNRRRSFAAVSRGGTAYNVAPYRKAFEAKPPTKKKPKQSKLAKKIYLLSNIIEKNRLLEEKRKIAELKALKLSKKKPTKSSLKSRLQKQMQLLKQSIENERMDRKIAKFARTQAMKEYRRNASK